MQHKAENRYSVRVCGIVARAIGDGFFGRIHTENARPATLGKALFHYFRNVFGCDLACMLRTLIDDNPNGWATLIDVDWSLPPSFGFVEAGQPQQPNHFERKPFFSSSDYDQDRTHDAIGWAYVFRQSPDGRNIMTILFKMFWVEDGQGWWQWVPVGQVDLDGPEPDWGQFQRADDTPWW